MRPTTKRALRILIGIVAGLASASLLSVCLLIFVFWACTAGGGSGGGHFGWDPMPGHEWVAQLSLIADLGIVTIIPLAGVVIGIIWARRRNKRDEASQLTQPVASTRR